MVEFMSKRDRGVLRRYALDDRATYDGLLMLNEVVATQDAKLQQPHLEWVLIQLYSLTK